MDLSQYIASLREDLITTAAAGDENTRRAAEVLAAAIGPAARLAIMNALSDLAAEVTAALDDHVVEVRLDGRDVQVVVTATGSPADDVPAPPPPPTGEQGDMSRMTLRLFEQLKARAEAAAAAQGVSLNTFVQQAVQSALHGDKEGWREAKQQWKRQWKQQWAEEHRGSGGGSSSRVHGWYEG
ncbi:MAG TPA: toxin-antitoxin system HicB family antitoxin [Actinophytocola sp.]|uniref:toxin-antitoxin system HicB family antitoxin n=1 Tax=Actinophytocola sp. TaxID=1872138 RepID=UPI002DDCC8AD|nr:toxin-antitoxin system HicB family antitoxin [Actinophytocola sp.]HEV2784197.1 toxin-antitoxin system HicB family antitoxin [Actinophytocola sp.]